MWTLLPRRDQPGLACLVTFCLFCASQVDISDPETNVKKLLAAAAALAAPLALAVPAHAADPTPAPTPAPQVPSSPAQPHATSTTSVATLSWRYPKYPNGPILWYQVTSHPAPTRGRLVRNIARQQRYARFAVSPGTYYHLYVRARNATGFSKWAMAGVRALYLPRHYRNCTALHARYPHGVGLVGGRDRTSGIPVTTFTRDSATYRLNTGSDRDKDGIACEQL
jgi:hypothetical protein